MGLNQTENTSGLVSHFVNIMAEDNLCALFFKLTVQGVTCSDGLKKHMENAEDELKPLLEHGPQGESMDIDEEEVSGAKRLLYLYVDCPTMMRCFFGRSMPYNCRGGTLLTDLPPYHADVSPHEVSRGLRKATDFFSYEDAIRSAYFAAFSFSGPVRKLDQQLELTSTRGEPLTFSLYARSPGRLEPGELVRHGECKFAG